MSEILKMYVMGTLLSVVVAVIGLVDSVGGLMYVRGPDLDESGHLWTSKHSSEAHSRGTAVNKNIGS